MITRYESLCIVVLLSFIGSSTLTAETGMNSNESISRASNLIHTPIVPPTENANFFVIISGGVGTYWEIHLDGVLIDSGYTTSASQVIGFQIPPASAGDLLSIFAENDDGPDTEELIVQPNAEA